MYFVDRGKIEEILTYMEGVLDGIRKGKFSTSYDKFALERMVHVLIESTLDVGNMMIDGFIMRDPGSYDDIIDILVDEKVLPTEEEGNYKEVIRLRKILVNEYTAVDHTFLQDTVHKNMNSLEQFSKRIREYLNSELGVANAFTNE
ncbi:DUF86 domain-containing protein [Virgibacillus xinjiangensis]|uniref:DUF86 domain-containing protein n=1 Tax=Virgibacillus xinjiangensis TaxID=393090 RepID=A0ABV7CYC3_9BACI